MSDLVAAELFKLRTTRTFKGIVLAVMALILLIVGLSSLLANFEPGDQPTEDALGVGYLVLPFALVVGVLGTSTEFRHGTITPTLLAVPDRGRLLVAKVISHLLAGLLLGLITFMFAWALSAAIIQSRDIEGGLTSDEFFNAVIGGSITAGLYAAIGIGIGTIVRNQVGATIGILAWWFLLEALIAAIPGMDWLNTYGLNGLAASLTQITDVGIDSEDYIDAVPAGFALAGIAVVFAAAGAVTLRRRDVEPKT